MSDEGHLGDDVGEPTPEQGDVEEHLQEDVADAPGDLGAERDEQRPLVPPHILPGG